MPYAEISARLAIPVDSIGPYRGRCLEKLRRHRGHHRRAAAGGCADGRPISATGRLPHTQCAHPCTHSMYHM
jgi:hypothetical protein